MVNVSHERMESVWRTAGAKGTPHAAAMQKRHQKQQKALAKFAYKQLLACREDAAGVGLYVFHMVLEAFAGLRPRPATVRRGAIDRAWAVPLAELDRQARAAEPHATQYLHEALTEGDDVVLTDEEIALCRRVIQAAIVCLHEACPQGR